MVAVGEPYAAGQVNSQPLTPERGAPRPRLAAAIVRYRPGADEF
jgi:hypothetical protein